MWPLWNYDIFINVNKFSRLNSASLVYCGNCLTLLHEQISILFLIAWAFCMSSALCMGIGTMCVRAAWEIVWSRVVHWSDISPVISVTLREALRLHAGGYSAITPISYPSVQLAIRSGIPFIQLFLCSAIHPFSYPSIRLSLCSAIPPFSYLSIQLSLRSSIPPFSYPTVLSCSSLGSLACCDMIRRPIYSCNI